MDEGGPLGMLHAFRKTLRFDLHPRIEVTQIHGGFHTLDDHLRREPAAHSPGRLSTGIGEDLLVAPIGFDLVGFVADLPGLPSVGEHLLRKRDGPFHHVAVDHLVDDAQRLRLRCRNGIAGENEAERLLGTDQPGQTLSAAGARQQTQLDLRQANRRRRCRYPVVAAQGHLETAAECGAVDGSDDGLAAALHHHQRFLQAHGRISATPEL